MALNSLSNSFNANNTGGRSGRSSGPLIKSKSLGTLLIFLIILLAVFSIIMIGIAVSFPKKVYSKDSNEEVLLNFIHNCRNNPLDIPTKSISASSSGNEYSLTFWFFINDLDANYLKDSSYPHFDILTKGLINPDIKGINTNKAQPIKIYLEKKTNTLRVDLKDISTQSDKGNVTGCYDYSPGPEMSIVEMPTDKNTVDSCSVETLRLNNNYFGMDSNNKCYYMTNSDISDLDKWGFKKVNSITDTFNCFQKEVLESKLKEFQGDYETSKASYESDKLTNMDSVNSEINKIVAELNSIGGGLPDNLLTLKSNIENAKNTFDTLNQDIKSWKVMINNDKTSVGNLANDVDPQSMVSDLTSRYSSTNMNLQSALDNFKTSIASAASKDNLTTALGNLESDMDNELMSKFEDYITTIDALLNAV